MKIHKKYAGSDSWKFQTLKYNLSNESNDILRNNSYDPELIFFSKNVKNLHTMYVLPDNFHDSRKITVKGYK